MQLELVEIFYSFEISKIFERRVRNSLILLDYFIFWFHYSKLLILHFISVEGILMTS